MRAILENSTACQKSMPSLISFCGVAFLGLSHFSGFLWLIGIESAVWLVLFGWNLPFGVCFSFRPVVGCWGLNINGEFDPGSGRTLAACLTHASRTVNRLRVGISGERVSNT